MAPVTKRKAASVLSDGTFTVKKARSNPLKEGEYHGEHKSVDDTVSVYGASLLHTRPTYAHQPQTSVGAVQSSFRPGTILYSSQTPFIGNVNDMKHGVYSPGVTTTTPQCVSKSRSIQPCSTKVVDDRNRLSEEDFFGDEEVPSEENFLEDDDTAFEEAIAKVEPGIQSRQSLLEKRQLTPPHHASTSAPQPPCIHQIRPSSDTSASLKQRNDRCRLPESESELEASEIDVQCPIEGQSHLNPQSNSKQDRQPILRRPFPSPISTSSPIFGASHNLIHRTCFRIGEAIQAESIAGAGPGASGISAHTSNHPEKKTATILIELFARVSLIHENEPSNTKKKHQQYSFLFKDLYHDRPPYLLGTTYDPSMISEYHHSQMNTQEDKHKALYRIIAKTTHSNITTLSPELQSKLRIEMNVNVNERLTRTVSILHLRRSSWEEVAFVAGIYS